MHKHLIIFITLAINSLLVEAQNQAPSLYGNWVSQGQHETRSLTFNDNGKGEFLSEHAQGRCLAPLDAIVDGQFVMAAGVAKNCQQLDNAVTFEFYCQQTASNRLRCKIHSKHQKSGNSKQGVEDFERTNPE